MKITALIDNDYRSLNKYFNKLFRLLSDTIKENDTNASLENFDLNDNETIGSFFNISQYIKPDMIVNIYGFTDFWLKQLCEHQKNKYKLALQYKDIKGKDDLDAYNKYLINYCNLDLNNIKPLYMNIDELRIVRNKMIHNGGFVTDNELDRFNKINHIDLNCNLIYIEDDFVWHSLDKAREFLLCIANAKQK